MNSIVPMRAAAAPSTYDKNALALIKRTVAADCNDDEFGMFIHMARALNLDPLRRQIYAFVFSKDKPDKRRMSIIVGIDGFRVIAERTGNYRPDENEPAYEVDKKKAGPNNPAGLIKATVRVWKFSHGNWHKTTGSARWEEYAPLKDEWGEDPKTGRRVRTGVQTLDTSGNWGKMPYLMLAKVAEALALRKAWPDDFSNVYAAEEIDRARALEMSPAELAHQGEVDARQAKIGGHGIIMDWMDGSPLQNTPVGQLADRAMAFIERNAEEPSQVLLWCERNRHGLKEFWAQAPGDALELKRAIERTTGSAT